MGTPVFKDISLMVFPLFLKSGFEIIRRINEDDGYGNGKRRTSEITKFVIICEGKTIYNGTSIPEDGTYGNYNIIRK